jgi:uncharacterized membrane protein YqgA involved in biofilm formation
MSRSLMLIILGALIALAPFSGLPLRVLAFVLPVLGLVAMAIGISYRRAPARTPYAVASESAS